MTIKPSIHKHTKKSRVVVSIEFRFYHCTDDNSFWTDHAFENRFWQRYLTEFARVTILARVKPVTTIKAGWHRVDSAQVSFHPLPHYIGPLGFVRNLLPINRILNTIVKPDHAFILRSPSILGIMLYRKLRRHRIPYAVEVVGDPEDAFAKTVVQHPLRFFFQWFFTRELRQQCAAASGVAYVTQTRLQQRYPKMPTAFTAAYSSIELPASLLVSQPRHSKADTALQLLFIGSLEQAYKGLHILLEAMAQARQQDCAFRLNVVGEGQYLQRYQDYARELGLSEQVTFLGTVSRDPGIITLMDQTDLFVHPSLTEGLPRVVIEAMSRGLPCVATHVGGIPELLAEEDMVPPNDAMRLAEKLVEFAQRPERRQQQAERNLQTAANYREDILSERRQQFYRQVALS